MEVLLLQDVNGIGKKNDLLVVGDGFALNCLLPKRMALVATPLVRRRYAEQIRTRAEERDHERQMKLGAAQALSGKTVTFTKKTTKTGKLYAAITEDIIADALRNQHGISISADAVQIATPMKAMGSFTIQVKLADQMVPLHVLINAESGTPVKTTANVSV